MIKVIVEMDDSMQNLRIGSSSPPVVALAVITAAYHELLSQKIQNDIKEAATNARRVGLVDGGALRHLPRAPGDVGGC